MELDPASNSTGLLLERTARIPCALYSRKRTGAWTDVSASHSWTQVTPWPRA